MPRRAAGNTPYCNPLWTHQVDVWGEFAFTPAFSLPVRLFLEAKH